jgi:hypothetical protein
LEEAVVVVEEEEGRGATGSVVTGMQHALSPSVT